MDGFLAIFGCFEVKAGNLLAKNVSTSVFSTFDIIGVPAGSSAIGVTAEGANLCLEMTVRSNGQIGKCQFL